MDRQFKILNTISEPYLIRVSNLKIGGGDSVNVGDLTGNKFSIILRGFRSDQRAQFESDVKAWQQKGFINYFGNQRFNADDITFKLLIIFVEVLENQVKTEKFYKYRQV